jgi:hypothetical protein
VSQELHAAAVLARLRTHGDPDLQVFDAKVDDGAVPPYVLTRVNLQYLTAEDRPDASSINFTSRAAQLSVRCYCVGKTAASSRAMAGRVTAALLNWTPVVGGRTCTPLRQVDSFGVEPNERTGIAYHELGDDYRCTSHPA